MSRDRDTFDMFQEPDRGRFGDNESGPAPSQNSAKLHDATMALHHETHPGKPDQGAILVSDNGDENRAIWIPKAHAEVVPTGRSLQGTTKRGEHKQFEVVTLTVPMWVAKEKELI